MYLACKRFNAHIIGFILIQQYVCSSWCWSVHFWSVAAIRMYIANCSSSFSYIQIHRLPSVFPYPTNTTIKQPHMNPFGTYRRISCNTFPAIEYLNASSPCLQNGPQHGCPPWTHSPALHKGLQPQTPKPLAVSSFLTFAKLVDAKLQSTA
jgi:hypothetical protein